MPTRMRFIRAADYSGVDFAKEGFQTAVLFDRTGPVRMLAYALRRIAGLVPTLFVLVTLSFFVIRLAPGGPFDEEQALPAADQGQSRGGLRPRSAAAHAVRALSRRTDACGDLGPSFQVQGFHGQRADRAGTADQPDDRFVGGPVLALLLGLPLGMLAALAPERVRGPQRARIGASSALRCRVSSSARCSRCCSVFTALAAGRRAG